MIEDTYPLLVTEIMAYIEKVKAKEKDTSLIDIIADFGRRNAIEMDLIGDAISSDVYFKSFIQKDCELHRYFKSDIENSLDEW